MDKQKEINEMAVKIDELNEMNAENIVCDNAYECNHTYSCLACKKAEALNNAGYRKADDLLAEIKSLKENIELSDSFYNEKCTEFDSLSYDFHCLGKENEYIKAENKKLKHDIAVRDKALENAVSEICYLKDNLAFKSTKKCFINQAEQELAKE